MQKITLWRPSLSTYFDQSYILNEIKLAQKLKLNYHFSPKFPTGPYILLSNTHLSQSFFSKISDQCELIIHANSGHDGIPASFVKKFSSPIILGNPIRANPVSEYVIWAICKKHFGPGPNMKKWDETRSFRREELADLKVQLIGFGHVGKILLKKLSPLFCEILIYDPQENKTELNLPEADIVIFCCELTKKNKHFFDHKKFSKLKDTVHIINPARGALIDEKSLLNFLKKNKNAHATLDVFENEPKDFNIFKKYPNLTATSHVAGVSDNLATTQLSYIQEVLVDFFNLKQHLFLRKYKKLHLQQKE